MDGWRITGREQRKKRFTPGISKHILLLCTIMEEEPAAGGRPVEKRKRVQSKVRKSIFDGNDEDYHIITGNGLISPRLRGGSSTTHQWLSTPA